jgi:hypothetical protein
MLPSSPDRFLSIFLDEAGDFDFSPNGSRYFIIACVTRERPFGDYSDLIALKYDLVEQGMNIEYFHAAEDRQAVRDSVFKIIERSLNGMRIDALVVEKHKAHPAVRDEAEFYPRMMGYLLRYVLKQFPLSRYKEVIVFTDRIPVRGKRNAVEKAVKTTLSKMVPRTARYRLLHHDSKSNIQLQIADYCNWAIYRKWSRGDLRSYDLIKSAVKASSIFSGWGPPFTTEQTTTPATLARGPLGLLSPGWNLSAQLYSLFD